MLGLVLSSINRGNNLFFNDKSNARGWASRNLRFSIALQFQHVCTLFACFIIHSILFIHTVIIARITAIVLVIRVVRAVTRNNLSLRQFNTTAWAHQRAGLMSLLNGFLPVRHHFWLLYCGINWIVDLAFKTFSTCCCSARKHWRLSYMRFFHRRKHVVARAGLTVVYCQL